MEATRNILRSEGVKGISVRSTAGATGYSFATHSQQTAELGYNFLSDLRIPDFKLATTTGQLSSDDVKMKINPNNTHVAGTLMFYLNRISPPDYPNFKALLQKQAALIAHANS